MTIPMKTTSTFETSAENASMKRNSSLPNIGLINDGFKQLGVKGTVRRDIPAKEREALDEIKEAYIWRSTTRNWIYSRDIRLKKR